MTQLPALTLDTSFLPPGDRLDAWRAAIPQYEIGPAADEPFEVVTRAWLLGDLVVTHTILSAVSMTRSVERIRNDGSDTYNLTVLLRGSWTGEADGQTLTVGPGQLVGFDLSRPFTVSTTPTESVIVVVGRSVLQDALRGEPDIHGRVLNGINGALLSDHCLSLARHLPCATTDDAPLIVRGTLALTVAALNAIQPRSAAVDAGHLKIRHEVRRYVNRHLNSTNLDPDVIRTALGLSRASLYRSFQNIGGVAAFIQRRRLEAVRALLLHPDETRTIGDIAFALGFTSPSHFATVFKKEFGCSPREVRATQRVPIHPRLVAGDISTQFQSWLKSLGMR